MRRREFVAALGIAATWPLPALAARRIPRIGFLAWDSAESEGPYIKEFEAALRELGYIPGESIEIEFRYADSHEDRIVAQAREIAELDVDVIASEGPGVRAAHSATNVIPIVGVLVGDLVAIGLAESLGHPGGNVTGQSILLPEVLTKRAALLREVKPEMKSVGVLFPKGYANGPNYVRVLDKALKTIGLAVQLIEVAEPNDCDRALSDGPGETIDGLVIPELPKFEFGPGALAIATAAARRGLPTAAGLIFARNAGALLGYGVEFAALYRHAATFVDRILKGAKPGDIAIEQPTRFTTIVNLKVAAALGLQIPPTVLAGADEVVE